MEIDKEKIRDELKTNGLSIESELILRTLLNYPCPPPYKGEFTGQYVNHIKFVELLKYIKNCKSKKDLKIALNENYYNENKKGIKKVYEIFKTGSKNSVLMPQNLQPVFSYIFRLIFIQSISIFYHWQ